MADPADARRIIDRLGLAPHPEGGWFRETWRHFSGTNERGAGTAILFLLEHGQRSHWHRVDATEIWHFHAGAPLNLLTADHAANAPAKVRRLGPDVLNGEMPQIVIPAGAWQAAETGDGWALVSCTVSPAFDFAGFELAPPDWQPGADNA